MPLLIPSVEMGQLPGYIHLQPPQPSRPRRDLPTLNECLGSVVPFFVSASIPPLERHHLPFRQRHEENHAPHTARPPTINFSP